MVLDWGGPQPRDRGPYKRQKRRNKDTEEKPYGDGNRDRHGRDVAAAQGHLEPPEAGRGRKEPPLQCQREQALPHLSSAPHLDLRHLQSWEDGSHALKPLGSRCFIITAPNEHSQG